MINDQIDIAIGKHRNQTVWQNKALHWTDIVAKCSKTHYTNETVAEYEAATKQRQAEIKDIGGFVGGYLTNGKRKKDVIQYRQLITLDADFAEATLWDQFVTLYGCVGLVYSTHKHTPEKPRLRLVIPLDRPVTASEYEPIARRITDQLGIEQFDPTTYDVNRLMYWPSTSKDGEFVFVSCNGDLLCADDTLATYKNWRDVSEWPVSVKENDHIKQSIKKQGDPLEKLGIIGAFCRSYSIEDVLEKFLPSVYEETAIKDRYTYTGGSTAAGMVVYESKFAYSHHSTDPISEKLVNAFDLVRLHKYGAMDEGKPENTPVNKLPSFLEMERLAMNDPVVRKLMTQERLAEAMSDFGEPLEHEANAEWMGKLEVDKKGIPHSTISNVITILENDSNLKGVLVYNEFEKREELARPTHWRKVSHATRHYTDIDDANIVNYIEKCYRISSVNKILMALSITFRNNTYHPIKDYLESLKWDGVKRLDTLLQNYFGAENTPYTSAVMRKTLVAGIARIYEPGCKFDYVLTLVGSQGIQKSSFFRVLAGDWFSDSFGDIDKKKDAIESIQGVWLVEIGELAGMRKASVESIK
ncbi:MAG: hypothetical protein DI598_12010, partial [Pseudopedobacter saltans]